MASFIQRLFGRQPPPARQDPPASAAALVAMQRSYWTPDPVEKERLLAKVDSLSREESLRLHHLNCLEATRTSPCIAQDEAGSWRLLGLGSIRRMAFPLDVAAPDFDERCRRRGMDPDWVRNPR